MLMLQSLRESINANFSNGKGGRAIISLWYLTRNVHDWLGTVFEAEEERKEVVYSIEYRVKIDIQDRFEITGFAELFPPAIRVCLCC